MQQNKSDDELSTSNDVEILSRLAAKGDVAAQSALVATYAAKFVSSLGYILGLN